MKVAPIGVACLLFTMTARFGFGFLVSLGWYVVTVLGGLAIHTFVVYPIALKLAARVSPVEFFRRVRTVMLTAFSTSSSNATLPTALRVSELNLGVPREIGAFVLTVGATANQNGTALYEGVTVLFLAQLAGVDLTLAQQLMIVYLAVLGSVGTAGVPSGSMPFVVARPRHDRHQPRAHRDHHRRRSAARHVPDGRERGGRSDGDGVRGEEGRRDAEYLMACQPKLVRASTFAEATWQPSRAFMSEGWGE